MIVKKIILVLLLAVVTSGSAWAQKGMMGVGINLAGNVGLDDGGIGLGSALKFQYNISDYFRLEPSISGYVLVDDGDGFSGAALLNVHAFFMSPRSLRPYAFAGAGYLGYDYNEEDREYGFGFDAGLGLDYRMSHHFSLQLEAGALMGTWDEDCIGLKFNLGVCYNF